MVQAWGGTAEDTRKAQEEPRTLSKGTAGGLGVYAVCGAHAKEEGKV
jgi:hypothetical protein